MFGFNSFFEVTANLTQFFTVHYYSLIARHQVLALLIGDPAHTFNCFGITRKALALIVASINDFTLFDQFRALGGIVFFGVCAIAKNCPCKRRCILIVSRHHPAGKGGATIVERSGTVGRESSASLGEIR